MRENCENDWCNRLNLKKEEGWLSGYMRVGCIRAMGFPSGSSAVAIRPTLGTSCFGVTIFPPSFLTLPIDSSMSSTAM